jgi:hypothetical protein
MRACTHPLGPDMISRFLIVLEYTSQRTTRAFAFGIHRNSNTCARPHSHPCMMHAHPFLSFFLSSFLLQGSCRSGVGKRPRGQLGVPLHSNRNRARGACDWTRVPAVQGSCASDVRTHEHGVVKDASDCQRHCLCGHDWHGSGRHAAGQSSGPRPKRAVALQVEDQRQLGQRAHPRRGHTRSGGRRRQQRAIGSVVTQSLTPRHRARDVIGVVCVHFWGRFLFIRIH